MIELNSRNRKIKKNHRSPNLENIQDLETPILRCKI